MIPNPTELALIDRWQHGFPLVEKPFEVVGRLAALDESETIGIFRRMRENDVISRVGAVVKPNTVGASTLAAMQVPPERLEQVAGLISREPLVTHNYEREHALNLWFVVAGASAEAIAATNRRISDQTGLDVVELPMLEAYHLGLGFSLGAAPPQRREIADHADYRPDPRDKAILAAIEDGLPLIERPYRAVADRLDLGQSDVIDRLEHMMASGIVTRFGCVVRHEKLGYRSNAMAVWDVPDDRLEDVVESFARHPKVTLCYRRPRHMPAWPYNIFCMVHARSRWDAYSVIDEINLEADSGLLRQTVLFSRRCFKQRGAVFSQLAGLN
ncbi:MAG: Lrp/AsnC family transcriptional regulator [Bradyrhizobium sp.]|uniref:siroheme decarboxylase subunit beta n=1 Tax=Bradyrhizobium sp. TaxID=376 RepID=UPI003D0FBB6C